MMAKKKRKVNTGLRGAIVASLGFVRRIVPQEDNDGREVGRGRGGCVEFPVRDGQRVDADSFGDLLLEQPSFDAALSDVIAQCFQFVGVVSQAAAWLPGLP